MSKYKIIKSPVRKKDNFKDTFIKNFVNIYVKEHSKKYKKQFMDYFISVDIEKVEAAKCLNASLKELKILCKKYTKNDDLYNDYIKEPTRENKNSICNIISVLKPKVKVSELKISDKARIQIWNELLKDGTLKSEIKKKLKKDKEWIEDQEFHGDDDGWQYENDIKNYNNLVKLYKTL